MKNRNEHLFSTCLYFDDFFFSKRSLVYTTKHRFTMPARKKSASKCSPKRKIKSKAAKRIPTAYARFVKAYWSRHRASLKLLPFAEASRKVASEYHRTVKGTSPPPPGPKKRPKHRSGGSAKTSKKRSRGSPKRSKRRT